MLTIKEALKILVPHNMDDVWDYCGAAVIFAICVTIGTF